MKKILIRITAALIMCAAVIAAPAVMRRYYARPISVKTSLADGEIIERVELSRGELWFKDEYDLISQRAQEDYLFVDGVSVLSGDTLVPYYRMNGGKTYSGEEMLDALNVYPEYWSMGGQLLKDTEYLPLCMAAVCFINGDPEKPVYMYDGAKACAVCYSSYNADMRITICAAPTPVNCGLRSVLQYRDRDVFGAGAYTVRKAFGDMDSMIGDIPVSVVYMHDYWSAFFIIGETAYEIVVYNCTQKEFVELILSVCNAPHPEKENYIDFLLQ